MKMIMLASALLAGCVNPSGGQDSHVCPTNVSYLCVGMEKSARFGDCPGCELDAKRLTSLMRTKMGYDGSMLISEQATKAEVVSRLRKGVENTPEDGLFLFFYSGHGGQEYLGGKEPDGADRQDEYLCLYDSHMIDDEIWNIVSKCRGRVFMYFDACHSATMYRSVAADKRVSAAGGGAKALSAGDMVKSGGFTFRMERFVKARPMDDMSASPRILCWSGCKEAEYSYGGSGGGTLTLAVIRNWKDGCSYKSLWDASAKDVNKVQRTQHPVQTYIGAFPTGLEAFR